MVAASFSFMGEFWNKEEDGAGGRTRTDTPFGTGF